MLFEPRAQRGIHVVRVFRQDDEGKATIPAVGSLVFGKLGPRVGLPEFAEHHDAELARDFFAAADDVTEFGGQLLDVLPVLEQLVVLGVGQQLALGIFLFLEHEAIADRVDVEAVLSDQRHLGGERVVVYGHAARDVALQFDRLCAIDFLHAQRTQPEGADDVRGVRNVLVGVFDGSADGFKIAPRLFQQHPVNVDWKRNSATT